METSVPTLNPADPALVQKVNYRPVLVLLTSLFFMWGLITSLNDILIPHPKSVFTLSYAQAMLIQFCFFVAYFVMSYPTGYLVEKLGYKKVIIIIGLALKGQRKDLASDPNCVDLNFMNHEELAEICYDNHASLAGGRIYLKPVDDFRRLADVATQMSMSIAFPIWGWIIENASGKTGNRSKGEKLLQNVYEAACHSSELTLALIGKSKQENRDIAFSEDGLIRPRERDEVFERIRRWAATPGDLTIRISDPYFGPEDLDVVHCIAESAPKANIRVLTSKKHLKDVISSGMFDDVFREAWKDLCELPPPRTEVVVIALGPEGGHPVHDRWIFIDNSGLRLGGSTNAMGYFRVSEISAMDTAVAQEKCAVIDELLNRKRKDWFGEQLSTSSFDLD